MRMRAKGWPLAVLAFTIVTPSSWAGERDSADAGNLDRSQSPFRQRIESMLAQPNPGWIAAHDNTATDSPVPRSRQGDAPCEGTPVILDGAFEGVPRPSLGGSALYEYGEWIHDAWYVAEGSVQLHRFKNGRYGIPQGTVLEINGNEPGVVTQTLTGLTPYSDHTLVFDYAVPPGEDGASILVYLGEDSWILETDADALGEWDRAYLEFFPTSSTEELQVLAWTGDDVGVILDRFEIRCGSFPAMTDPGAQYYTEGDVVSLQLDAEGEGDLWFDSEDLPPGLSIDSDTGLISGTIEGYGAGFYRSEIEIEDEEDTNYFDIPWHIRSMNGLVASYPFSEGEGDETEDHSGYENMGYLTDDVEWIGGVEGSAVKCNADEFDPWAEDEYEEGFVYVEASPSLTPHQEYTFSGWVRSMPDYWDDEEPATGGGYEFSMIAFQGEFDEIGPDTGGPYEYWDYYFGQWYDELEGGFLLYNEEYDEFEWGWVYTYDLPVGQWYHLAVTTDGHGYRLYINGELDMVEEWPEGWELASWGAPLQLGGVAEYFGDFASCDLDEIRIYDRELTPEEIAEFAGALGEFGVQNPGNQTNDVGDEVDLRIQAVGGAEYFFSEGLPHGLELNEITGRITGELEFCDAGVYTVFVAVVGPTEEWEEFEFLWTVNAPAGGLVSNHSFEEGTPVPDGGYVRFEEDDDLFGTWSVEEGEVDLHHVDHSGVGNGLDTSAGHQVLELNGGGPGVISMEIEDLDPGQDYVIRFLCASHPRRIANMGYVGLGEEEEEWEVYVGPGTRPRGERWIQKQFVFEAEDSSTELYFWSADDGPFGLLIDKVEIFCAGDIHEPEDVRLPMQPASNFDGVTETRLHLNQPNPFSASTEIRYDLGTETRVLVNVFAVDGRKVRTLVDAVQSAGSRAIEWDGKDDAGHRLGSGTYLLQLQAGTLKQTQRLVMIR